MSIESIRKFGRFTDVFGTAMLINASLLVAVAAIFTF